ncbi:hypothetical protein SAMN04490244_102398 [Tranquillimonas rosea]|uniref:Uncharacterized protein n=1 Tax=Tranquillimonas rosea TaxID=641238 RepID=A0A1H9RQQ9_9RHOB|nr:hypothetical protein [Tranquillimonas rosea]SER74785.1 hypothetical protein SAMN04490244_102398 [Tranquillimonas rosea]
MPRPVLIPLCLAAATLCPTPGAAEEPDAARVEMVLIQEGDKTVGMAVSVAHGPYTDTASFISPDNTAVSTGAIASVSPVVTNENDSGYTQFTSQVGATLDR